MKQVVKQFCESSEKTGLLLLDMPTGTGKTHSVVDYIYDAIQNPAFSQKIFFVTTKKNNLPEDKLKQQFVRENQLAQYKEKYLRLESYADALINGFSEEVEQAIPNSIRSTETFKIMAGHVKHIKRLRAEGETELNDSLKWMERVLRENFEPEFRKMVQVALAKNFHESKERLYAIKTDKRWQWVGKLYPSVFLRERQIVFLSMSKFLRPCSTLVEAPTMLYNSDFVKDAIIFIDEFDATKETVLKIIVENELREKIDCVEFFLAVYSALQMHRFPVLMTMPSERRQQGKYADRTPQDILDETTRRAEEIHRKYFMQYSYKTEQSLDEDKNNFLFQDHRSLTVLRGENSYVNSVVKHEERINEIQFSNRLPREGEQNVLWMLEELRRFIEFFIRTVYILANNYQEIRAEGSKRREDRLTIEESVRSVLAEFKLAEKYVNYLTDRVLMTTRERRDEVPSDRQDESFYEKGFRYYALEDDFDHDMESKIMMYTFDLTPEKLLLHICRRAKVLGISATASLPSVTGNYDLSYLRSRLKDQYHTISSEDRARLEAQFAEATNGYHKVNIHTQLIGCNGYSMEAWEAIAENEELARLMADVVEQACCAEDSKNYDKERYIRIAEVFKAFLLEKRIQSLLCVLTKHPREYDRHLDWLVLIKLFGFLVKRFGVDFSVEAGVVQLDSDGYEEKKSKIVHDLGEGARRFVISVYQTIGDGQNLQHPIPEDREGELVTINDRKPSDEKDFDAIYLDKPTNLITQLDDGMEAKDFVQYLYEIEMLQESGEVAEADASTHIKQACRCYGSGRKVKGKAPSLMDCPSVIQSTTRVVIQAVGRMCRTNRKSKNIFLFADNRLADRIDYDECEGRMLNPEFIALINTLKGASQKEKRKAKDVFRNRGELKSRRADACIRSMVREMRNDEGIRTWKEQGVSVLVSPTLSEKQVAADGPGYRFYIEQPFESNCLYYKQEWDFEKVELSFEKRDGMREVSAEAANLTKLMRVDFLRRCFEENGWATSFVPNRYILSPPMFKKIYCGRLGEVVGRELFDRLANVRLVEIEDNALFELFDYIVPNSSIYVDFKNWHEGSFAPSDAEERKVVRKAKECGCKCVIVANILAGKNSKVRDRKVDGIRIIVIPALLTNEERPKPVERAWDKIRGCICEYADSDQPVEG